MSRWKNFEHRFWDLLPPTIFTTLLVAFIFFMVGVSYGPEQPDVCKIESRWYYIFGPFEHACRLGAFMSEEVR